MMKKMKDFQRFLKKIIKKPSLIIKSLKRFISFYTSLFLLIIIKFYDRNETNNGYTKLNLSKPQLNSN